MPTPDVPALSTGLTLALSGLLVTSILFLKDWLTHRSLVTTLSNIQLNAQIALQELAVSKEAAQERGVDVKDIKELCVQTHTAVNSQRDRLEGEVATQKAQFESTIAVLRSDLDGVKALHQEMLIQREKDHAEAAVRLKEAQLSPAVALPAAGPPLVITP